MFTVIAGKRSDTKRYKIISLSEEVSFEKQVEFEVVASNNLKPGEPRWANYVKGCIAYFTCKFDILLFSTYFMKM